MSMEEYGVMISVRPEWCELIASGQKTIEVRKTKPKLETPFMVYIYQTSEYIPSYIQSPYATRRKPGAVIGEFVCDKLVWVIAHPIVFAGYPLLFSKAIEAACMTQDEAEEYSGGKDLIGWQISQLRIYDKPKKLSEFHKPCQNSLFCERCGMWNEHPAPGFCGNAALQIKRAPQDWCYAEKIY